MKRSKKSLALILMISSIVLLLVLQGLWIANSYERAYLDLNRDANIVLHSTVSALRDSIMMRKIERMPSDTTERKTFSFNALTKRVDDSVSLSSIDPSKIKKIDINTMSSQVQVYISSTGTGKDSVNALLRPLATRFADAKFSDGGRFIIRIGPDSLSQDTLRHYIQRALKKADIDDVSFSIHTFSSMPPPPMESRTFRRRLFHDKDEDHTELKPAVFSDSLASDRVRFNPFFHYSITLHAVRPMLIKAIAPQLLFSVFLTALTAAAFIVLYRNIRSQQRLMEIKNDFISNMTHELKTPIATVSVALEALKNFNGMDNPKLTAEYLDIAQHELNRLTLLTDKVLKTSLFEEQGISYVPEQVDMAKTIEQVLSSMKLVFEKNKASVSFTRQGSDFHIRGGAIHLTNVIHNLLENALKYSKASPAIAVTLKDNEKAITFSVQDNGIGIPPEYKGKIFEKFFRVPTGDVHTIKGYGLGLSYVDSVVKSHQGKIEVESTFGGGSTFTITLPKKNTN